MQTGQDPGQNTPGDLNPGGRKGGWKFREAEKRSETHKAEDRKKAREEAAGDSDPSYTVYAFQDQGGGGRKRECDIPYSDRESSEKGGGRSLSRKVQGKLRPRTKWTWGWGVCPVGGGGGGGGFLVGGGVGWGGGCVGVNKGVWGVFVLGGVTMLEPKRGFSPPVVLATSLPFIKNKGRL